MEGGSAEGQIKKVLLIALLATLALGCRLELPEETPLYGILRLENVGLESKGVEIDGVDIGVTVGALGGYYERAVEEGYYTVVYWWIPLPEKRGTVTVFVPGGLKLTVLLRG